MDPSDKERGVARLHKNDSESEEGLAVERDDRGSRQGKKKYGYKNDSRAAVRR
jgi:hypothetical protein